MTRFRGWRLLSLAVMLAVGVAADGFAQGLQNGVITGSTRSSDGLALPGVTVTVSSSALQGTRSAATDINGNYVIRGLPPGDYSVAFELQGMSPRTEKTIVALGRTTSVDATLTIAAVEESINVVAEASPVVSNTVIGANYTAAEINALPNGRTPQFVAELAPGLTDNTPNTEQVTISGGFAFDNVFLVDGVDVNDNIFGSTNNLYIEDAVEETQILTSGISAEYGRFSGGVVNVVTKRGGNKLSGSFRDNLSNPSWSDETPFETAERRDDLQQTFEATLGGPILKDRLWFFGAFRDQSSETPFTLRETSIPGVAGIDDRRFDIKLTGTIASNHTVSGSYLDNKTDQTNVRGISSAAVDPHVLFDRQLPQKLGVINWSGVLSPKMFATAQWSKKQFGFRNSGGKSTELRDSPFRTPGGNGIPQSLLYSAPYFDGNDPENRDNQQLTGSLSYFLSTKSLGSHDVKGGVEWFRSHYSGGNSQSPTSFVYWSNYLTDVEGAPITDAQGRLIPDFVPGVSWLFNWQAERGAQMNTDTTSFYVHDRWAYNRHWTFDLGARYERVRSEATGDIVGADTDTLVPRLAASWDIAGDGRFVAQATYAHYAGKYSEAQFTSNTDVGNPSLIWYGYTGPAGQGLDFAPGLDPANYPEVLFGSFATANVSFEDGLSSALNKEFTVSFGSEIGTRGYGKATFVRRRTSSIIDDFIDTTTGTTEVIRNGVNFGTFDNIVYRNAPDDLFREYRALVLQGRYRLADRWVVEGHWTVQLKNEGNTEGELSNQPGVPSAYGDYPEVFNADRHFPTGRVDDFQRSKVRLWTIYTLGLGKIGELDLTALWRYNTGLTYSLVATGEPLSDQQVVVAEAAGYQNAPNGGEQDIFFGKLGRGTFPGFGVGDFGVNYAIPVWKTLKPYLKLEVLNAFNNQKRIGFDTTVSADWDGPVDNLGLPLNYVEGPRFGESTQEADYPAWRSGLTGGRTILAAFGFRF
jgi:hypothetical protein